MLPWPWACQKGEAGGLSCLVSSSSLELQPDQDVVLEGAPLHFLLLIQLRAASVNSGRVTGHWESRLDLRISRRKNSACWRVWEGKVLPCLMRKVKKSLPKSASTHVNLQVSFCQEASCFTKCETELVASLSNNLAEAEKLGGHFSFLLFLVLLLKQLLFLYNFCKVGLEIRWVGLK